MEFYFRWVLKHRAVVLIVCGVITLLAGVSLSRVTFATSLTKLFIEESQDHQRYLERVERYGGNEQLLIGVAESNLGAPEVTERLKRIVTAIESLDGVTRVLSLFQATSGGAVVDIEALSTDPLIGGLLVSTDGRHATVLVEFEPHDIQTIEQAPQVVGEIRDIFEREGFDRGSLHFGGFIAMIAEIARQAERNLLRITPIVTLTLLFVVYLFFRRLWPVWLTGLVALVAMIWTLGFAALLDRELNIILAIAPALVLIVSFSDVVHICSAYARELAGGRERDEAVLSSAIDVGTACILTSLTTFVGFVSLSFVGVAVFRRFGFVLGFGTAVALVLAMTVVPIVLSMIRPPPWSHEDEWRPGRVVDWMLGACERIATARPALVIAAFALAMGICAYGCSRIRIEADFVKRMAPGSALRADTEYFNTHFAGTIAIELFLTFPDGVTFEPRLLQGLLDCANVLRDDPSVVKVVPAFGSSSSMRLDPSDWKRFVDVERKEIRLVASVRETGAAALYEIGERLRGQAQQAVGDLAVVEASGFFYLAGRWLDDHIASNQRAVVTAFLTITLILVVLFRSIRIGFWSLLPNVLPMLAIGGVLGFVWGEVDSDMVILLVIAIGIAVDDTIHFISRWQIEIRRGVESREALRRAFAFAGRAIIKTSVIFAIGFAPLTLSGYLPIRMLGVLMPLAVLTALVGDLLLLPALVRVGAIRVAVAKSMVSMSEVASQSQTRFDK